MLLNEEKERWHYLAVKNYLHITWNNLMEKHEGDFYGLNCTHSFRRENKLKIS